MHSYTVKEIKVGAQIPLLRNKETKCLQSSELQKNYGHITNSPTKNLTKIYQLYTSKKKCNLLPSV